MKKMLFAVYTMLCLLCVMLPIAFAENAQGWTEENGAWKYCEDGVLFTGVRWIEREGNRYLFDENGVLQMGDAEGNVFMNGNLYFVNPDKDTNDPSACYAVQNYTRVRPGVGITYYDSDGIAFVGWVNASEGRRMYQTRIPKENVPGAADDLYIYVWRAQYLPECQDPDYPGDAFHNIPAGWYLFDDNGLLVQEAGWHTCNDGKTYRTNAEGQILNIQEAQNIPFAPYDPAALPQGELPLEYTTTDIQIPDWHYSVSGDEVSAAVLAYINAIRAEKGLAPLTLDADLDRIAVERCRAHVNGEPFDSHEGMKDFEGWEYRGENCAKNYDSACDLLANGLYNTPASYEQLLIPGWKRIGIGYAYNRNTLQGLLANGVYTYWVLVFEY